jgi:hypothetical protein
MAALAQPQRLLTQGAKALVEYVPVTVGGAANAGNVPALDANGQLGVTMLPTGVGPDTQVLPATEAISAGALVNVWVSSGTVSVRNADGSTVGKEADGFVLAAVTSGNQATVYLSGLNTAVSGLTAGLAYLSDTTVGGVSATGATTAGHTYQQVGVVTASGVLQFSPQMPVTRS